jgi:hypothetical protein
MNKNGCTQNKVQKCMPPQGPQERVCVCERERERERERYRERERERGGSNSVDLVNSINFNWDSGSGKNLVAQLV